VELNDIAISFYDDNSPLCNATVLRKATRRVSQIYDDELRACGLKTTQRSILRHVDQLKGPTATQLAEVLVLDKTALSHNLKPLIRDGYLVQKASEGDKRIKQILLTDTGREKLLESHKIWVELQNRFESALSKEQHQTLLELLALVVSDNFNDQLRSK
jgi:DNA-binding MarR family transcriptional regulator